MLLDQRGVFIVAPLFVCDLAFKAGISGAQVSYYAVLAGYRLQQYVSV
jgi:hypothetical protein